MTFFIQFDTVKTRKTRGERTLLITRETDYALRILRGLSGGELMTAGALSQREQVPQQFGYKILKKLDRAGLVKITRGAEGGCCLTADLEKTTLYDLLEAMEEDRFVISCMETGYQCTWRAARNGAVCGAHCRLAQVQQKLDEELKSHSLAEILFGS